MFADKELSSFWAKVDRKDDINVCWEWMGCLYNDGYGAIKANGRNMRTHRMSMMIHLNREIITGMYILHACDNRKCCNPHHLREGTAKENMQDRVARNEFSKGEKHPNSKLNDADVVEIRRRYERGDISQHQLARDYKCHVMTIHKIVYRKTWAHV